MLYRSVGTGQAERGGAETDQVEATGRRAGKEFIYRRYLCLTQLPLHLGRITLR